MVDLPRRGNSLTKFLGRATLASLGWKIEGNIPPHGKFVAIAAPHTSNWDFIVGISVIAVLQLHVLWLGKHTLFRRPFGPLFRWLGGIPVDRSSSAGVVQQISRMFAEREQMILGLSPEGTRKKVERWKTGFYHIAIAAGVPILLVAFDYGRKCVILGPVVHPSGQLEADLAEMRRFFGNVKAKHPELADV
jgi:1-acyl-sn-glycerol-3-phosphate acyltransferase